MTAPATTPLAPLCRFCEGFGYIQDGPGAPRIHCENCCGDGRTWYYECDGCRKTFDQQEHPIASGEGPLCRKCVQELALSEIDFTQLARTVHEVVDVLRGAVPTTIDTPTLIGVAIGRIDTYAEALDKLAWAFEVAR